MTNTDSKPCRVCNITKPFIEFSKDSQLKSGISNRCKTCDKIKNSKRTNKGFNWKDVSDLSPATPESELADLFGTCDIWTRGKLVMKKGKILDDKWYQKKLRRLKKGRKKLTNYTPLI